MNHIENIHKSRRDGCFRKVTKDMKETLWLMMSYKMLYIVPEIAWTGISLAIYTGMLVPMISASVPVPKWDNFSES
jgi:hypothetical protein